jgi:hypothetical protein
MSEVQAIVFTCQNQERRDTAPSATILKMVAFAGEGAGLQCTVRVPRVEA